MTRLKKYPLAIAGIMATMTLTPMKARADDYCREYTREIRVGGRVQQGWGSACLRPDGQWEIQNEQVNDDYRPDLGWAQSQPAVYRDTAYYHREPVRVVFVEDDHRHDYWMPPGQRKKMHRHQRYEHYGHRSRYRH